MNINNSASFRGVRPSEVMKMLGISKSTLWEWVKSKKNFPKPIKISYRVALFNRKEIEDFIEEQKASN